MNGNKDITINFMAIRNSNLLLINTKIIMHNFTIPGNIDYNLLYVEKKTVNIFMV